MEIIKLFLLGSIGYFLSGLYDVAILYGKSLLRRLFFLGFIITAIPYPLLPFIVTSPFPPYILWIIVPLLLIFALLLVYSVFIEIRLGSKKQKGLYQKGTYSFSRHPGFLWYTTINFIIAIYFYDIRVTYLCAGFILCNLILISIEDMVLFPLMFSEYEDYKKRTPFLLSLHSLLFWRRPR